MKITGICLLLILTTVIVWAVVRQLDMGMGYEVVGGVRGEVIAKGHDLDDTQNTTYYSPTPTLIILYDGRVYARAVVPLIYGNVRVGDMVGIKIIVGGITGHVYPQVSDAISLYR
jgi:hypothetical protein